MYYVLVVVNCVCLQSISFFYIGLLAKTSFGISKLLLLHYIIICAINDDGSEKLIEIGAKFLRALTDHFFILRQNAAPQLRITESSRWWELCVNSMI